MQRLLAAATTAALVIALAPVVAAEERTPADAGKRILEMPAEDLLRETREESGALPSDDNPRVPPGLVRWHDDLTAARAAARESGKPVLLFQLLGRLDEEFC